MVDITLKVYNRTGSKLLEQYALHFGRALSCSSRDGWDWVEEQGMRVDPPWSLDNRDAEPGSVQPKQVIVNWIKEGYLSIDPAGRDQSAVFLDRFNDNSVFRLSFLDWS